MKPALLSHHRLQIPLSGIFFIVIFVQLFFIAPLHAQLPMNRINYKTVNKIAGEVKASSDDAIKEEVKKMVTKDSSGKLHIDTVRLKTQIETWVNELQYPDSINAYLAHSEGDMISLLKKKIDSVYQQEQEDGITNFRVNSSSKQNAKFRRLNEWSTALEGLAKQYYAINSVEEIPQLSARLFPGRNRYSTALVYQRYQSSFVQFGSNVGLFGWDNKGTINPEVISFIAGPFRFGLNTVLSSAGEDANKENLAKLRALTANGGNLVLGIYSPIYHQTTNGTTTFAQFSLKAATEVPVFGSPFTADTLFSSLNLGIDLNFNVNLPVFGKSSLYFYARPAYVTGTGSYLKIIGAETDKHFWIMQSNVGIDIANVGRIGASLPPITGADKLHTNTFLLTLQLRGQASR